MADIKLITQLRSLTGAPMKDCISALEEAGNDIEKAKDILRKSGAVKAAKREGKVAAEGMVTSYIHAGGKIGVLVELNCETDFVAKTDGFKDLARDVAMHIAAANPLYLSRGAVPADEIAREKAIYVDQLKTEGKPEQMIEKIIPGKLNAFYEQNCLLDQEYIKDEEKTVQQLIQEKVAELGEKIVVRRFVRYELGEGIVKEHVDFAAEVEAQLRG